MPQRIQRRRTAGWKMPEGAIYVGRGSKWGNPWRIVKDGKWNRVLHVTDNRHIGSYVNADYARQTAASQFLQDLIEDRLSITVDDVRRELAGRDLCCWCPPSPRRPNGAPVGAFLECHGDYLLDLANA